CDPRLRQIGHRAQPLDHRVQFRRLVALDYLRAGGGERELVGGVVLEEGQANHDHDHRDQADVQDLEEDYGENDIEEPEQEAREEHPRRETRVASKSLAFHRKSCSLKGTRLIVVSAVCLSGLLNLSATAQAAPISVRVVPSFDPAAYAERGAVGLMVPGVGATVTRGDALASLERGKTVHALLGGRPHGKVIVRPSAVPGTEVTVYVSLPPLGRTANHRRYPIAVVGCGLHGLLTSSATRIDGLISIADIAPAVEHARKHHCGLSPLGAKAAADAPEQLRPLDRRIKRVHDARGWALVAVVVTVLGLSALGGAPGVLGCASAVAASLTLSAGGVEAFWALVFGLAGLTAAFALVFPLRRLVPYIVTAFLV